MTALRFDESEGMQIAVGTSGGQVRFSISQVVEVVSSNAPGIC